MLNDTSEELDLDRAADCVVPRGHGADPFACPCCANVFREVLRLTERDIAQEALAMPGAGHPIAGSVYVTNARILTMDEAAPHADAMIVRDGRLVWIGRTGEAPSIEADDLAIDLEGKTILPGFIEPHMHLAPLAMLTMYENVGPFRYPTTAAALDRLALAERWDQTDVHFGQGDEWIRATGWKIVSDGSNQGYTGLQREPFLNSDSRGIAYIEVDELNDAVRRRLQAGWPVCVHANGDAAIDRALDAFQQAEEAGLDPGGRRCRIEHCSILHDEHIEQMARLGISPSFLIGHVYYWGKAFVDDVFGLEKAEKLDRTGACEAKGIRWTVHSDDPVTEMGPLRCIENAVSRAMWRSEESLAPAERISVEAALRSATIDAAWQCHSDHEVGSLEVGKYGDFVVLDRDPRSVPVDEIGSIGVLETWVNGRQVYAASDDTSAR